jgi:PKD repeat protein
MKPKQIFIIFVLILLIFVTSFDFFTGLVEATFDQSERVNSFDDSNFTLENEGTITLEIDLISSESACPGVMVNYFLILTNGTENEETITFSASGNAWTTYIDPPSLVLAANSFEYVYVSVLIPWTAIAGDQDVVTISAVGQYSALSDTATLTTITAPGQGWEDLNDSPEGRGTRGHAIVYWDGSLYKLGGFGYVDSVGGARPWLDIYDIATDTWRQGANMPLGRYWIDCEAIDLTGSDPKIYCAGGYVSSGRNTLYIYDINTDVWTTGASLPETRYNYASVVHNNMYYVIGGYTTDYTATMLVYNPATNTWDDSKAPMSVARRYFSAGLIDNKIYAAGGYNGEYLSSMEVFDIDAGTWSAGADLPAPWVNAADGVIKDRFLLMVGGFESGVTSASNRAYIYDAVNNSWTRLPSFIHTIYGAEGGSDGTDFWVVSGRLYEGSFQNSTYTTKLVPCEGGVCVPVTGADFTWEPETPTVGEMVTFTATVGEGTPDFAYTWDFGDGIPRYGEIVYYTFSSAGTLNVDLTITNCDGSNSDSVSKDVIVVEVCTPVTGTDFTWEPTSPTAGSLVTFSASIDGGTLPIDYDWDFGDGSSGSGESPVHIFTSSGSYTVTLTASNCGGASTDTQSYLVTVSPQVTSFTLFLPLILK